MRITCNVFIKGNKKKEMSFMLKKDTPIAQVDDPNKCAIFIDGADFIIDRSYKEIDELIKQL